MLAGCLRLKSGMEPKAFERASSWGMGRVGRKMKDEKLF
jgi:hypothetical protein